MALIEARGPRSSCDTLLTNSLRVVYNRCIPVWSCSVSRTPSEPSPWTGMARARMNLRLVTSSTSDWLGRSDSKAPRTSVWSSWSRTISATPLPTASGARTPSIDSAARFSNDTLPSLSITSTPSAIRSSRAASLFLSAVRLPTASLIAAAMRLKALASSRLSPDVGAAILCSRSPSATRCAPSDISRVEREVRRTMKKHVATAMTANIARVTMANLSASDPLAMKPIDAATRKRTAQGSATRH